MKYSLKQLFEVIDEKKSKFEFYAEDTGGWGVEHYIDLITYFEPDNECKRGNTHYIDIIKAYGDCEKVKNLDKNSKQIDVSGILVYDSIPHTGDFEIFRLKDIKEVEEFMCSGVGLTNMFTGDIVILENGKRKKYFIKDLKGNILTYYFPLADIGKDRLQDKETGEFLFTIEWED